ncbi:MAG: hypothetical protein ACE15F_18140 [bacterium]
MKKIGLFNTVWIVLILGLTLSAAAQIVAVRSFHENAYVPDAPVHVSLTISSATSPLGPLSVTEKIPKGWEVTNISNLSYQSVVNEDGITWKRVYTGRLASVVLTYRAIPPRSAAGDAVFSGNAGDQVIGGQTTLVQGENKPIGIFYNFREEPDGALDWPVPAGTASYNSQTGEYTLTSGGTPGTAHVSVYTTMTGNFSFQATIRAEGTSSWCSGVIGIEDSWDWKCVIYDAWVGRYLGGFAMWRDYGGDIQMSESLSSDVQDGRVRIVREGNTFRMDYFDIKKQAWTLYDTRTMVFTDPVYVGLAAYSGEYNVPAIAYFTDVELIQLPSTSSVEEWELYR